nr:unnamed protein product [Digitaria exilis]
MASKISLKLLVDNKTKKVLFAEAGKEFVDFVFSLLTLPIGAVVKLISAGTMHGSIGRLYQSVDSIGVSYLQPGADKKDLLHPKVLQPPGGREPSLLLHGGGDGADTSPVASVKMYTCPSHCVTVTMEFKAECPQCRKAMTTEMTVVLPSARGATGGGGGGAEESGGYVKGVVTYMVTDGLEVTPTSAISSFALISRFSSGKDVDLAEKFVTVGMDEGLALLNAALRSDTVLTDVFLARKK